MSLHNPSEFNSFFGIRLRTVHQRCKNADVRVAGDSQGAVEAGLLALVGFTRDTTPLNSETLEEMQNCAPEFDLYLVSQFTLLAGTKKGNRPSDNGAFVAPRAKQCFEDFVEFLRSQNKAQPVCSGVFGADMEVSFINDGRVTLIFDCSALSGVTSL